MGHVSLTNGGPFFHRIFAQPKFTSRVYLSHCFYPLGSFPDHCRVYVSAVGCARVWSFSGILLDPHFFPPNGLSVLVAPPPRPGSVIFPLQPHWASSFSLLPGGSAVCNPAHTCRHTDGSAGSHRKQPHRRANGWQIIRHIMVPLILPALVVVIFNITLNGINGSV